MRRYPDIPSLRFLAISCCLVFHAVICMGQEAAVYNINKYNGLSSNHVYCTLVDRLGYLWLGTTDGVYRYNGFTLRKYDYKDGLPNVDVWTLYEDKQGRIWFGSISQQIAYIHNNNVFKAFKGTTNKNFEIYPGNIVELNTGELVFVNQTTDKEENSYNFCIINADTLKSKTINTKWKNMLTPSIVGNNIVHAKDSILYLYDVRLNLLNNPDSFYTAPQKMIKIDSQIMNSFFVYHYIVPTPIGYYTLYKPLLSTVMVLDIRTGKAKRIDVRKVTDDKTSTTIFCYYANSSISCITNESIIMIDDKLNVKNIPLNSIISDSSVTGFSVTYFIVDSMWGSILATNDNGLYIKYGAEPALQKIESEISDYTFINNKNDTDGYWWNAKQHILATVSNGRITEKLSVKPLYNPKKIVPYDSSREIIVSNTATYWLSKGKSYSMFSDGEYQLISPDTANDYDAKKRHILDIANDIYISDNKDIYLISAFLRKLHVNDVTKTIVFQSIYRERFRNIMFNSRYNLIICYTNDKVLLLNPINGGSIKINQLQLQRLGLNAIEKIMTGPDGSILIKDYNSIKLFNPSTSSFKTLLTTYKLEQAKVEYNKGHLYIAGNFGLLKARISRDGSITIVNTFQNTKNIYYKYLHDVQFSTTSTFLKTDKGLYIYRNNTNNNTPANKYQIIAGYGDSLHLLSDNDTLAIPQDISFINFDVIKPTGTGILKIEYSIDNSQYQHSENQVILPVLTPGSYNTVSLIASDDSWRSKPIRFIVYIQPKWWQTSTARRIIFVFSLLVFIGFIYLVIVMTRRMVNRNNERRNQRRELELKSIYSQINPHFIFNSLSTAQYFVRKNKNKEAFEHINQFSDLLRAYIKSSRAKYITIAEEIENLENYLQLQLTRFEEKFDYHITIDTSVNPQKVKIPSLLLQPLVENALNHGIFHSETKGNLHISFKVDEQDKDTLICIVDDNGVGRQKSKELRGKIIRKADSYGTILIKELIDTFNKYEKINIEIEYIDKQLPQTGTTVIIRIKNFTHAQ